MVARCGVFIRHKTLERVHLSFLKRVLSVKKSSQNDFIYGMMEIYANHKAM